MKNYYKVFTLVSIFFLSVFSVTANTDSSCNTNKSLTIVDVASSNSDFSSLVLALKATGLDGALNNSSENFTVFAPTNAAFDALMTELKISSLNDIPKETLTMVLLYHVKSGKAMASQIETGYYPTLSNGPIADSYLSMYVDMSNTTINGRSKITKADIPAGNGVIHVIDRVLLPMSIADNAIANPTFSSLVAAVSKANLVAALADNSKTYTVFAPTNDAFSTLFASMGVTLTDLSAETLSPILLYHVMNGYITDSQVDDGYLPTLSGAFGDNVVLKVVTPEGVMLNNSSKVITTDVVATNGIIHVIDKVLLPPTEADLALKNSMFSTLVMAE